MTINIKISFFLNDLPIQLTVYLEIVTGSSIIDNRNDPALFSVKILPQCPKIIRLGRSGEYLSFW